MRCPFNAKLLCLVVGLAFHSFESQFLRYVAVERLGNDRQLAQLGKWLYARDDRYGDTHRACFLHKFKVFRVVIEQLRHGILRPQVLLLFEILHVHLEIGRLVVLFGITCHTEIEFLSRTLYWSAVGKESLVESVHLTYEVGGVLMSSRSGYKPAVLLGLVATQQQEIADAQELQVEQFVFYGLYGGTAAYHVRLHWYAEFVLYSRGNGYGARASAHPVTLQQSVVQLLIHKLAVMRCDVNKQGVEFLHFLDCGKQFVGARTFQWGQYLEGEMSFVLVLIE